MSKEIVKIDPKEFGLNEKQVESIEQAFLPKIQERDGYTEIYGELIKKEITPETEKEARELRLKLVKVRTGIAEIHKTQKAFFLAAGRFVDAWKNKETAPIEQMEENLEQIEKFREIQEKKRIAELSEIRKAEVSKWSEVVPEGLGTMEQSIFDNYLQGLKVAYQARIDAEKKAEQDRIDRDKAEAEERERIRVENERLKAEAEKREKEIEAERKKQAAILEKERAKAEADRKEAERIQKEKDKAARIEREKIEAENKRIQAQLRAKEEADRLAKEEADRLAKEDADRLKKAAKAPDKTKLLSMIESVTMQIPEMKTKEGQAVKQLIIEKLDGFKAWATIQVQNFSK